MKNKTLIIQNPKSGPRAVHKIVKKLLQSLKLQGKDVRLLITQYAGHATKICQEITKDQYENIIICGGDGTFNEAINGLMSSDHINLPNIGFLPGGSGNAFMHDLQATNPDVAIQKILTGKIKKIDILQLEFNDKIEYAINIVGWGMVTDILILSEKIRLLGPMRYSLATLFYIFNIKKRKIKCIIDNNPIDNQDYLFVLVANTIHTGKGMKAAPKASIDDGLVDIILLKATISKFKLFKLFLKIFSGEHIHSKYIKYLQGQEIKLIPAINEVLNIDGEVKAITPIKISVIPKIISIYN